MSAILTRARAEIGWLQVHHHVAASAMPARGRILPVRPQLRCATNIRRPPGRRADSGKWQRCVGHRSAPPGRHCSTSIRRCRVRPANDDRHPVDTARQHAQPQRRYATSAPPPPGPCGLGIRPRGCTAPRHVLPLRQRTTSGVLLIGPIRCRRHRAGLRGCTARWRGLRRRLGAATVRLRRRRAIAKAHSGCTGPRHTRRMPPCATRIPLRCPTDLIVQNHAKAVLRLAVPGRRGTPPPLLGDRLQRGVASFIEQDRSLAGHVAIGTGRRCDRSVVVHQRTCTYE